MEQVVTGRNSRSHTHAGYTSRSVIQQLAMILADREEGVLLGQDILEEREQHRREDVLLATEGLVML